MTAAAVAAGDSSILAISGEGVVVAVEVAATARLKDGISAAGPLVTTIGGCSVGSTTLAGVGRSLIIAASSVLVRSMGAGA
jgi:hypothetical protein